MGWLLLLTATNVSLASDTVDSLIPWTISEGHYSCHVNRFAINLLRAFVGRQLSFLGDEEGLIVLCFMTSPCYRLLRPVWDIKGKDIRSVLICTNNSNTATVY